MTNDTCGHPTEESEPCQLPASRSDGKCHLHTESGDRADAGRSSKFDDVHDDVLEAAGNGTTKEGCARAAGIHPSTLYDWLDQKPEFSEAFNRARARAEQQLVEAAAEEDPKWVLERSYGYVKTERHEVEADIDQTTTHELGDEERDVALETIRELQERESQ